jgi:outer membrane autotransporter protein
MKSKLVFSFTVAVIATSLTTVAADQIVTASSGTDEGSLRKAVADAGDGDRITFSTSATNIMLSGSILFSGKSLTVSGTGDGFSEPVVINGNGSNPVFVNTATTSIDNIRITGGRNAGTASGGGIRSTAGMLNITNVIFTSNTGGSGGALFNGGTAIVQSSTFQGNYASDGSGGGGAIRNNDNTLFTGTDLMFISNSAANLGGAIRNQAGSSMTLVYTSGFSGTLHGNKTGSGTSGFLYLYTTARTEMNVAGHLTIGESDASATAGLDSMGSSNASSTLTKSGTGTLVLNADNTKFLGTFNINEGVVQVSSTLNLHNGKLSGSGILALDNAADGFAFTVTQNSGSFNGVVRLQNGTGMNLGALDDVTREFVTRATLQLATGGTASVEANNTIGKLNLDGGTLLLSTGSNGVPKHMLTVESISGTAGAVRLSDWDGASGGGTMADGLNLIDQSSMVDVETVLLVAASSVGDVSRLKLQDKNGADVDTGERRENLGAAEAVYGSISLAGSGTDGASGLYLSIGQKLKELAVRSGSTFELSTDGYAAESTHTLNATITGDGGNVRITGSDTIIFASVNTHTGKTTLAGSVTLVGGRQDVIAGSAVLEIEENARFQTGNHDQLIKSLAGRGGVEIAADTTLTLDIRTGGSSAFGGVIGGQGVLKKTGGGIQTLQSISTTGTTRIDAGTLEVPGVISGPVINASVLRAARINQPADNLASGTIFPSGGSLVFQDLKNNGTVSFAGMAIGGTIVINGNLTGDTGKFAMNVNLDTNEAHHIVAQNASGSHEFVLTNTGTGTVARPDAVGITLVTITGSNAATFDGTVYDSGGMTMFAVQQDGGRVFLATPKITIAGGAILLTAGAAGTNWHYSLDSLRLRMGELRGAAGSGAETPGFGEFWVKGYAYRVDAETGFTGAGFVQDTFGVKAGFDRVFALNNGTLGVGGFLSLGQTLRDYDHNGDGNTGDFGAGAYAILQHKSGLHADFVVSGDLYKNEINAIETAGTRTRASYDSVAWGASLEAGWRLKAGGIFWMEPSMQAAVARLSGESYATSSGLSVHIDGATAAQYRMQLTLGANLGRWRLHTRAGEVRSDTSGGLLHAGTEHYDPQFDGWRFETGFGLSFQADANKQWYLDYEYNKAELYTRPWAFSLGCRFAW